MHLCLSELEKAVHVCVCFYFCAVGGNKKTGGTGSGDSYVFKGVSLLG